MNETKSNKRAASMYEWVEALLFALVLVLAVLTFAIKTYMVNGTSMVPTLKDGQRVMVYGLAYRPVTGDIVIIDANNNLQEPLIKRVVATAGQTVDIDPETGDIFVDGIPFNHPIESSMSNLRGDQSYPLTVPAGYVFVMGDNRGGSLDSRYKALGFVDARSVLGKQTR